MITHKIDTGGAKLIRQPLRRTSQGFEGEEEKYLKDQIAIGVVKRLNLVGLLLFA